MKMMAMVVKSNEGEGWMGRMVAGRDAAIVVPLGPCNGNA